MARKLSLTDYKKGILSGDRMLLGKAITLVESSLKEDQKIASKLIESIFPFTGKSYRIGISGIPGAGKSTFIEALGKHFTSQGKKVAVLAVDPSSKISGGSILGDKTRMNELARNELAFIRPTPANTTLGGVAGRTFEALLLCEAAGFEYIFIETVGVGQSETEVFHLTDLFLLLMITGMGDELQSMKKGIMELADFIVVNKADGDNKEKAKNTVSEIQQILHVLSKNDRSEPTLISCSAIENTNIPEIASLLEVFRKTALSNGQWVQKRSSNAKHNLSRELTQLVQKDFHSNRYIQKNLKKIENEVAEGNITPQAAALLLFTNYKAKNNF
jgi:LAO/AO transport system kinase